MNAPEPTRTCSRCGIAKGRSEFSGLARICISCRHYQSFVDMREEKRCAQCGLWKLKRENFAYRGRICHECRVPVLILKDKGKTTVGRLPKHRLHFTLERETREITLYRSPPIPQDLPQTGDTYQVRSVGETTHLDIERDTDTLTLSAPTSRALSEQERWSLQATLSQLAPKEAADQSMRTTPGSTP